MAERVIRKSGDPALYRPAKEVASINAGIIRLLDDMIDTMRANQGLGLAAPQLGIGKRIFVAEFGDALYEMINPELVLAEGEEIDIEGCLSFPNVWAEVARPSHVIIKAMNRHGEEYQVEATDVLARALCHELDHLQGEVFTSKVIRYIDPDELESDEKPSIRAVFEYRRGESTMQARHELAADETSATEQEGELL